MGKIGSIQDILIMVDDKAYLVMGVQWHNDVVGRIWVKSSELRISILFSKDGYTVRRC